MGACVFLRLNQPIDQGVDTGAGMVVLDPPVTVANIAPGSPFDFFLLQRIYQVRFLLVAAHQSGANVLRQTLRHSYCGA